VASYCAVAPLPGRPPAVQKRRATLAAQARSTGQSRAAVHWYDVTPGAWITWDEARGRCDSSLNGGRGAPVVSFAVTRRRLLLEVVRAAEVPQAHQAMWENRHAGATYVVNYALPRPGLKSKGKLYEAWASAE
jgi:hypothetical protein